MEYIKLAHSIKSKDENGKILAEITFPENDFVMCCVLSASIYPPAILCRL